MNSTTIPTRSGLLAWAWRKARARWLRMKLAQAEFDATHWEADALVAPAKAALARQQAAELRVQLALVE